MKCTNLKKVHFNPNWHEEGHFPPPVLFGSDFVSFWLKNSKCFWRSKLASIGLIWHHAKRIESLKNILLGGAKVEHFSCLHSSCQLGLIKLIQKKKSWPIKGINYFMKNFMNHVGVFTKKMRKFMNENCNSTEKKDDSHARYLRCKNLIPVSVSYQKLSL